MSVVAYLSKGLHFYNGHRIAIFFALVLFCTGVFFSSLVPPFQSPDEYAHLKRAYLLSKGRIAMETPAGESTGGYIDTGLNAYMGAYNRLPGNLNNKVTLDIKEKASTYTWSGDERFGSDPGINYYLPFIYLPQTFGLLIGQWADLTIEKSYYLARYSALLFSIFVILIAFTIARLNVFALAVLSMPLMVFQMVSTSQDGFSIALLILAISLFIKLTSFNKADNRKAFYTMSIIILIITTSRINLLPLLILPFAAVLLTTKSKKEYFFSAVIACLTISWILYALSSTVDNRVAIGASTKEIIGFYVQQPISFVVVLFDTLSDKQISGFYLSSFVGVLGWLDTSIGSQYISAILCCLALIFVSSISWREIKAEPVRRIVLIFIAITSFLLTFFLLLITWTKHPAITISGVQGRYLWGPALLLAYGLTTPFYKLCKARQLICTIGVLIIASIVVFKVPSVLIDRYYAGNKSVEKPPLKHNFDEVSYSIVKNEVDMAPAAGGFIDSVEFLENGVELVGWGFFSTEKKEFLSNIDGAINVKYKTKVRQDVANAYKDESLQYSGFTLFIEKQDAEILSKLCLYTKDPEFGVKQLIPGNADMLYTCVNK